MAKAIEKKYLIGLTFRGSRKGTGEGAQWEPFERPLAPEDVLSWVEAEDQVTIVSADGRKHVVSPKQMGPTAPAPGESVPSNENAPAILDRDVPGKGKKK